MNSVRFVLSLFLSFYKSVMFSPFHNFHSKELGLKKEMTCKTKAPDSSDSAPHGKYCVSQLLCVYSVSSCLALRRC